jgi:hypothetical protein
MGVAGKEVLRGLLGSGRLVVYVIGSETAAAADSTERMYQLSWDGYWYDDKRQQ